VAVRVIWDERFLEYDFGPQHPFSEVSRGLAVDLWREEMQRRSVDKAAWSVLDSVEAASDVELERFHAKPYIELVRRLDRDGRGQALDSGDTPSFPGCFRAASRVVGGALAALEVVRATPAVHAFHPAGGLHHAHPDRASGFCIFDDVALTIASALGTAGTMVRVAYIDLDVHHGDGVMYGYYDDGRVLDIDFHQDGRTIFPGTGNLTESGRGDGAGLKVNLPLPPGAGDEALVALARRVVPPLLRSFRPELIVVQHGVDGHAGDRLGALRYTAAAYQTVLRSVHELAHELCEGRLVVTGGGGYTAENVSRILAGVGVLLAREGNAVGAKDPLPEKWRERFEKEYGRAAPPRWADPVPDVNSPWSAAAEDRMVRTIEQQTGVRMGPAE
jgi:acetoin utilization protein AcuC